MGGYAAMAFARLFAQRSSAVALIATRASADTDEAKEKRERQAQAALERGPETVTSEFVPKLLGNEPPAGVRHRVEELAARATKQGIADALRGMAMRPDSTPDPPSWKAPALVIAGGQDQLIALGELEKLARGIPGAGREAS